MRNIDGLIIRGVENSKRVADGSDELSVSADGGFIFRRSCLDH
jgi:hypothetical protein